MAQSDPEPEPAPAADSEATSEATTGTEVETGTTDAEATAATDEEAPEKAEVPEKTQAEKDAEAAEQAHRTVIRFLWSCAWLTVMAGVFLVSGMTRSDQSFTVVAWLGAVLTCVCLIALVAVYVACARERLTLRTRVLGSIDLFQVSTVVVVIAVICGLLVPTDNKAAIALLFPWALAYWMYGLDRTKKATAD